MSNLFNRDTSLLHSVFLSTEIEGVSGSGSGDHGGGSGSGSGYMTEDNKAGIVDIDSYPPVVTNIHPEKPGAGGKKPGRPGGRRPGSSGGRKPAGPEDDRAGGSGVIYSASWTLLVLAVTLGELLHRAVVF